MEGEEEASLGTSFDDDISCWLDLEPPACTGSSLLISSPFDESGKGPEDLLHQVGSLTYRYLAMHTSSSRPESSSLGLTDCGSEGGLTSLPEGLPSPELVHQHVLPPATDPWAAVYGDNGFDSCGGSSSTGSMGSLLGLECHPLGPLALDMMNNDLASIPSPESQFGHVYPHQYHRGPGYNPGFGPVDSTSPVTLFPGPANTFAGSPVQDS